LETGAGIGLIIGCVQKPLNPKKKALQPQGFHLYFFFAAVFLAAGFFAAAFFAGFAFAGIISPSLCLMVLHNSTVVNKNDQYSRKFF